MNRGSLFHAICLLLLLGCGSDNPFTQHQSNWRLDGEFVDYKEMGLPGVYESQEGEALLQISAEGQYLAQLPAGEIPACTLEITGTVATLRALPKASASDTISFGSFKATTETGASHFVVVEVESLERLYEYQVITAEQAEHEDSPEALKECFAFDLSHRFNESTGLFLQPLKVEASEIVLEGVPLLRQN